MESRQIFVVILVAVAVSGVSSDDGRKLLPRQPGRPRPPPPPPPVEPTFRTSCVEQKRRSPHISCEENGNFSLVQCMGPRCFCVTPDTGERINSETFSKSQQNSMQCSATAPRVCSSSKPCNKVCPEGYEIDGNMCQTCTCKSKPPIQRCPTIGDLVVNDMCSCQCVVEPPVTPPIAEMTTHPPPTDAVTIMATGATGTPPTTGAPSTTTMAATTMAATTMPPPIAAAHRSMEDMMSSMCPTCNTTCSRAAPDRSCAVTSQEQCSNGTTLASVGRRGRPECVPDLGEQEKCTPEEGPMPNKIKTVSGASKRSRAGQVNEALPPCAMSLVCKAVQPKNYVCTRENPASPCVMARRGDSSLRCNPEGDYRPLQCRKATLVSEGTTHPPGVGPAAMTSHSHEQCRCVYQNGTGVAGSMRMVTGKSENLDCDSVITYEDCSVAGVSGPDKKRYRVAHGESYFDANNCRTCECRDGNETALCSSSTNCTSVGGRDGGPANCRLSDGSELLHGEQTNGCEKCGCRNGKLRCTRKAPRCDSGTEDACDRCKKERDRQVCGPDGRNHLTLCSAVQCAGIPAVDLQEGPCLSQNACEEFPCGEDEVCINKKGTVACMGIRGCKPDQLRTCLNVSKISCPVVNTTTTTTTTTTTITATIAATVATGTATSASTTDTLEGSGSDMGGELVRDDSADSTLVCGTDGLTYQSICHLIQTTSNVQVLYAGDCNATECEEGEVCGTDGFTYNSLCELRNQAAVRLQYPGECLESGSNLCSRVAASKRCKATPENCDVLVNVPDSCCPVCGGAIELVIDVGALTDASETNPEISTVDAFTISLLDVIVLRGIDSRCNIEATLNNLGNLMVIFEARSRKGDSSFCNTATHLMERLITTDNSTPPGARTKRQAPDTNDLSQAYAFVMAASVAAQTDAQAQATTVAATGTNGDAVPMPMGGVMTLLLMLVSVLA